MNPFLTNIFQRGWFNHQPEMFWGLRWQVIQRHLAGKMYAKTPVAGNSAGDF